MLPPDGVVRAARRWLRLLRLSPFEQAASLIRSSSSYTDLSPTQYGAGLEWLIAIGMVEVSRDRTGLSDKARLLPESDAVQLLFTRALEAASPAWLADADMLVHSQVDIPADAVELGEALGVSDRDTLRLVQRAHARVDLEQRQEVGSAGELALVDLLHRHWAGSCVHVALESDAFGYDVVFTVAERTFHLEVKSTTRRGRLVVYVSRHEFEVSKLDPAWRLVVVGLDATREYVGVVATVSSAILAARAPRDVHVDGTWASVRVNLARSDLEPGLSLLNEVPQVGSIPHLLRYGHSPGGTDFAWLPGR